MWRARRVRKVRYGTSETPQAQRRICWYVLPTDLTRFTPSAASAYTGRYIARVLTRLPRCSQTLKNMCESSGTTSTSQKPTRRAAHQVNEYVDCGTSRWLASSRSEEYSENTLETARSGSGSRAWLA